MTLETVIPATVARPHNMAGTSNRKAASVGNNDSFDSALAQQRAAGKPDAAPSKQKHSTHTASSDKPAVHDKKDKQDQATAGQTPTTAQSDTPKNKTNAHATGTKQAQNQTDAHAGKTAAADAATTKAGIIKIAGHIAAEGMTKHGSAHVVDDGKVTAKRRSAHVANDKVTAKQAATLHAATAGTDVELHGKVAENNKVSGKPGNALPATVAASETAKHTAGLQTSQAGHAHTSVLKHVATSAQGGKSTSDSDASLKLDVAAKQLGQQVQSDGSKAVRTLASAAASLGANTSTPSALHTLSVNAQTAAGQPTASAAPLAASSTPAFAAQLQAPMGTERWNQALQQQSLRLTRFGGGRAQLTLYPADLGQIQVSLKMGSQAQLHFAAQNPQARAAVQAALPQLQQAFADSGINLGQTSVSDQGYQPFDSDSRQPRSGFSNGDGNTALDVDEPVPMTITRIAGRTAAGGIDIFA